MAKEYTHYYSDPHFGHKGVCEFLRNDGVTKMRPWDSYEEMDDELVYRYNQQVGPKDLVWFAGDVVINRRALPTLERLNGRKKLVAGNHDIFKLEDYMKYFEDIKGVYVNTASGFVLSHVPLHPSCISQRWRVNVHGHTHYHSMNSPLHFCVCVEQIDYTPVEHHDMMNRIKAHRLSFGVDDDAPREEPVTEEKPL